MKFLDSLKLDIQSWSLAYFFTIVLVTRAAILYERRKVVDIEINCEENLRLIVGEIIEKKNKYVLPVYAALFDYHGQLQTVIQALQRTITSYSFKLSYHRELIQVDDGGQFGLDWISKPNVVNSPKNIVLIKHGLCGSSSSEYIVHIANLLLSHRFQVVAMVGRGCGGIPLTSQKFFVASVDGRNDIELAVQYLHKQFPNSKLFGLGFSLGGAALLKMLGKQGKSSVLCAAVSVSPPWDMTCKTKVFDFWSPLLATAIKYYYVVNYYMLQNTGISIFKFLTSFSLDAVDSHLIHLNGYDSLYDYRYKTSPAPTAWNIATPTLSISAEDDPVCDVRGCPCHCTKKMEQYQQCLSQHGKHIGGPGLIVVKTAAGGHLGFPNIGGSSTWTDNVILDWFNHFAD